MTCLPFPRAPIPVPTAARCHPVCLGCHMAVLSDSTASDPLTACRSALAAALAAGGGAPFLLLAPGLPAEGLPVTLHAHHGDVLVAALRRPLCGQPAGARVLVRVSRLTAAVPDPGR